MGSTGTLETAGNEDACQRGTSRLAPPKGLSAAAAAGAYASMGGEDGGEDGDGGEGEGTVRPPPLDSVNSSASQLRKIQNSFLLTYFHL